MLDVTDSPLIHAYVPPRFPKSLETALEVLNYAPLASHACFQPSKIMRPRIDAFRSYDRHVATQ